MNKPAGNVTLSAEDGEALIARVHQSNLNRDDAGVVEWVIRTYFWVAFALQEAKLSMKRLRALLFGKSSEPKEPPASETEGTSSEALGEGEGEPGVFGTDLEVAPASEEATGSETAGCGVGTSQDEVAPKPKGGHRPGTGSLGADAYVGAERIECRHEELAVGQRCPACGQGTLYELPR